MKRWMSLLLVLVMALGLCACGADEYAQYRHINEMLDNGDYEGALYAVEQLYRENCPEKFTQPPTQPKPTDEEWDMINKYRQLLTNLNSYVEDGSIYYYNSDTEKSYSGSEALACIYEQLQGMAAIDDWLQNTDYISERFSDAADYNWDRQSVLDSFLIVPDMKISQNYTLTDNMGNVNASSGAKWQYDAEGQLVFKESQDYLELIEIFDRPYGRYYLTYDEQGRVSQRRYGSEESTDALVNYAYDGNGHLASALYKDNNGEREYTFTCDAQGRVVKVDWTKNWHYELLCTYDAAGNILKMERIRYNTSNNANGPFEFVGYKNILEYTYENGKPVSAIYRDEGWSYGSVWDDEKQKWDYSADYINRMHSERQDEYVFTCDEQGRIVTAVLTPGTEYYTYGENKGKVSSTPSFSQRVIENTYADYFIYDPAQ